MTARSTRARAETPGSSRAQTSAKTPQPPAKMTAMAQAVLRDVADRPQVVRAGAVQRAMAASPRVTRLAALQQSLSVSAHARAAPVRQRVPEERVQAKTAEDEEPLQGKGIEEEELLQGKGMDEEEPLQAKPGPAGPSSGGLPAGLRAGVEQLSGLSLADVRVHRNSARPAQVGALAYAQGRNIHLGPGQEKHLPHEAWHVVQQAQGRVRPTMQAKGVAINDDPGLEAEADRMGAQAQRLGTSRSGHDVVSVQPGDGQGQGHTGVRQRATRVHDTAGPVVLPRPQPHPKPFVMPDIGGARERKRMDAEAQAIVEKSLRETGFLPKWHLLFPEDPTGAEHKAAYDAAQQRIAERERRRQMTIARRQIAEDDAARKAEQAAIDAPLPRHTAPASAEAHLAEHRRAVTRAMEAMGRENALLAGWTAAQGEVPELEILVEGMTAGIAVQNPAHERQIESVQQYCRTLLAGIRKSLGGDPSERQLRAVQSDFRKIREKAGTLANRDVAIDADAREAQEWTAFCQAVQGGYQAYSASGFDSGYRGINNTDGEIPIPPSVLKRLREARDAGKGVMIGGAHYRFQRSFTSGWALHRVVAGDPIDFIMHIWRL